MEREAKIAATKKRCSLGKISPPNLGGLLESGEAIGQHAGAVHSNDGRWPRDGLAGGGPEPRHSGGDVEDLIHIELGHFAAHDVDEQAPHTEGKRLYIFDRAVERFPHCRTKRKRD
jgi:hypothetical protein